MTNPASHSEVLIEVPLRSISPSYRTRERRLHSQPVVAWDHHNNVVDQELLASSSSSSSVDVNIPPITIIHRNKPDAPAPPLLRTTTIDSQEGHPTQLEADLADWSYIASNKATTSHHGQSIATFNSSTSTSLRIQKWLDRHSFESDDSGGGGGSGGGSARLRSSGDTVSTANTSVNSADLESCARHVVSLSDTLEGICLRYKCQIADLKRLNNLWTNDSIHLRKELNIPPPPLPAELSLRHIVSDHPSNSALRAKVLPRRINTSTTAYSKNTLLSTTPNNRLRHRSSFESAASSYSSSSWNAQTPPDSPVRWSHNTLQVASMPSTPSATTTTTVNSTSSFSSSSSKTESVQDMLKRVDAEIAAVKSKMAAVAIASPTPPPTVQSQTQIAVQPPPPLQRLETTDTRPATLSISSTSWFTAPSPPPVSVFNGSSGSKSLDQATHAWAALSSGNGSNSGDAVGGQTKVTRYPPNAINIHEQQQMQLPQPQQQQIMLISPAASS